MIRIGNIKANSLPITEKFVDPELSFNNRVLGCRERNGEV
jgi:hypothetical protein